METQTIRMNTFTAVIRKENALYVAHCPEVETTSQGKTIEIALKNLQEATALYLEEFPVEPVGKPIITTFEVPSLS